MCQNNYHQSSREMDPFIIPMLDRNISSWLTMSFKNEKLERRYRERLTDPLLISIRCFRIFFILLLVLIIVRRIELLIFSFYDVPSEAGSILSETVNSSLLLLACLTEIAIFFVGRLRIIRGLFAMIYIFFMITYSSYSGDASHSRLRSVPM